MSGHLCDGARPTCRGCEERDLVCQYGQPTGPQLAQAQKRKIEELEEDKSSLYEVLWYLQTTSPEKASALLQLLRAAQGEDIGGILKQFKQSRSQSVETPCTSNPTASESPASAILAAPGIMDHPRLSTVRKHHIEVTKVALLSPAQSSATVDRLQGPLKMFFDCIGVLFYVMAREDADASIVMITASGNNETPIGDIFSHVNSLELRTYAAELAGMAAIGVVHAQLADPAKAPPAELADYFYAIAKHGLDSAILYNPLRAMKVCALIGMYNVVVKATVALAYIGSMSPSPLDGLDVPPEDMIRRECIKVSIIKAALLHRLPTRAPVPEVVTLDFRTQLSRFHAQLPESMTAAKLLGNTGSGLMTTFRPVIFYVHLFYLSAMMLLARRLIIAHIPLDVLGKVDLPSEAQRAIEEGYHAAQMNASVMNIMLQEGKVVQVCWLCIYTAYTAGVMIAHKATQKALHGISIVDDVELLNKCVDVLEYCAQKDALAVKFRNLLTAQVSILQQHDLSGGGFEDTSADDGLPVHIYLLNFPAGSSPLHNAARYLLRIIHRPFSGLDNVLAQKTLSNRAETTMGTHLEWEYELKGRDCLDSELGEEDIAGLADALGESGDILCTKSAQGPSMQQLLGGLEHQLGVHGHHRRGNIFAEPILQTARTNNTHAFYHALDIQDEPSITTAFTAIFPLLHHPIRGLVHCAAISGESDACTYPTATFRRILDVNLTGTFLIARAVASQLHRTQQTGSIVFIASISGHVSNRGINTAAYNASKAGVHQLCRSLAAEWGHPQNTFPGSTVSETNPEGGVMGEREVYPPIRVNSHLREQGFSRVQGFRQKQ
ncbi:hypothetical protein CFE70_004402 [Pyrenophora teres f. teres 0-1]